MALPRLPHLGPGARKALRIVGFVVLGLVTFVFALQWTFPFQRVKDKIIEVLSVKYEVEIGEVERGLIPGRMFIKALTLRTRPTKTEDVATTFYVERLEVDVGLFALMRGVASVDIDAKIGPGHITGNISLSKKATEIHLVGENLPSERLPIREAVGLPMSGRMHFNFDLDLPNQKLKSGRAGPNWQKAEGGVMLACRSGCTFGDGKTKLKPKLKNNRNQAFAGDGIEFGKVNIESLLARVDIGRGQLTVKEFDAKSNDGELEVLFSMTLAQDISDSIATGCLRFTGSQALLKREAKTFAAISTTGAPLGPDNLYHIKLDGKVKEMKRLGQICGPSVSDRDTDAPTQPSRPNLTIQPESEVRPPAEPTPTPQFNQAVPADAGGDAAVTVPTPAPEGEGSAAGGSAANGSAGTGSATPPPPGVPAAGEPLPPPPPQVPPNENGR